MKIKRFLCLLTLILVQVPLISHAATPLENAKVLSESSRKTWMKADSRSAPSMTGKACFRRVASNSALHYVSAFYQSLNRLDPNAAQAMLCTGLQARYQRKSLSRDYLQQASLKLQRDTGASEQAIRKFAQDNRVPSDFPVGNELSSCVATTLASTCAQQIDDSTNNALQEAGELYWLAFTSNCGSKRCPFENATDKNRAMDLLIYQLAQDLEK